MSTLSEMHEKCLSEMTCMKCASGVQDQIRKCYGVQEPKHAKTSCTMTRSHNGHHALVPKVAGHSSSKQLQTLDSPHRFTQAVGIRQSHPGCLPHAPFSATLATPPTHSGCLVQEAVSHGVPSEDGPRTGIPENSLILYSGLIVVKVVGCVSIYSSFMHIPQPLRESGIARGWAHCNSTYM